MKSTFSFVQCICRWDVDLSYFMVPINSHRGVLTNDQQQYLKSTYLALYPGLSENDVDVNATIQKYYNVSTPFRQYGAYTRAN